MNSQSRSAAGPADPGAHANLVFDRQTFDQLVEEVGEDAVEELLSVFFCDTEAQLETLRQLSLCDNRESIKTEAHTLKSTAASFGFLSLSEFSRTLEAAALDIDENTYRDLLGRIEREFARARACPCVAADNRTQAA